MVRALPNSPWHLTDFLGRVRPGLAISIAAHAALLLALAYALAFSPPAPHPDADDNPITVVDIPPPPTKVEPPKITKFQQVPPPKLDTVPIDINPYVLPPVIDLHRPATTETVVTPTANDIIVDPTPVYRGSIAYPDRALDAGRSGFVDVAFMIEPDGSVGEARIVDEVPPGYGFANAALKAFGKWRFDARTVNGKPVAWPARIRISFELK
jgi:protein TonB